MRLVALAPALLLAACTASAARTPPPHAVSAEERVVQAHLDAFNRGDLEAFMATYAPDAVHLRHPADTVFAGAARLRQYHGELFADVPALRAEVVQRMVSGRFVVDHERVHGLPGQGTHVDIVVYEVVDGRIRSATFLN